MRVSFLFEGYWFTDNGFDNNKKVFQKGEQQDKIQELIDFAC
jgi:hypothetical protein